MAYPYSIHEKAREEYILAYEWYETAQLGLGSQFMNAVEARLLLISDNPEYYSFINGRYRQVKVAGFPFVIVYQFFPRRKQIHISAIIHSRKSPSVRLRKEKK